MMFTQTRIAVAVNTVSQVIGRVATSGTTFIISLLLAKRLGPDGYGDFSKITTYIAFFYLLVDLGLNTALLQQQQENTHVTYRHLVGLRIIVSIIAVFVAISLLVFLPQGIGQGYTSLVRLGILIYSVSILTQGWITTTNVIFQRHLEYKRASVAVVAGSLVTLGLILLFGGSTVLGTVVIFFVGSLVTASASFGLAKPLEKNQSPLFSFRHSISLFKTALPLSLTLVFNLIYFRVDSIILTLVKPTFDVGIYNFAYKIFELPLVFPTFFMNALFPIFLQEHASAPIDFQRHIKQGAIFLCILSLITAIVVWICAPFITTLNSNFSPSVDVVRILSIGIPFFFLSSLTMWILITLKKRRELVAIYGLSMVTNIVANILFIPIYGYMGAAWITVLGEGFVLCVSAIVLFRNRPEKIIKKISIIPT
jgi:O-antigen/teichoic acid export membrane protein